MKKLFAVAVTFLVGVLLVCSAEAGIGINASGGWRWVDLTDFNAKVVTNQVDNYVGTYTVDKNTIATGTGMFEGGVKLFELGTLDIGAHIGYGCLSGGFVVSHTAPDITMSELYDISVIPLVADASFGVIDNATLRLALRGSVGTAWSTLTVNNKYKDAMLGVDYNWAYTYAGMGLAADGAIEFESRFLPNWFLRLTGGYQFINMPVYTSTTAVTHPWDPAFNVAVGDKVTYKQLNPNYTGSDKDNGIVINPSGFYVKAGIGLEF